jgi:hypothetical protein
MRAFGQLLGAVNPTSRFVDVRDRDVNAAFRLYRSVCRILGDVIDLYQLSDCALRSEFVSTEQDRERLLDDAIYELDAEGNVIPLGKAQWGENSAAQEKYATLLACALTAVGALHIKRQEALDAVNAFKPAVCYLKHRLQQQGVRLGADVGHVDVLPNPPAGNGLLLQCHTKFAPADYMRDTCFLLLLCPRTAAAADCVARPV